MKRTFLAFGILGVLLAALAAMKLCSEIRLDFTEEPLRGE